VGYRDIDIGEAKRFEVFEFSEDIVKATNFIASMSAISGNRCDHPEDV
jgi:hypothetical protein